MQEYIQSQKILTYDDVLAFKPGASTEPLVDVRTYDPDILSEYLKRDMLEITGGSIFVRDSLARKLAKVNQQLKAQGFLLKVVYGYRHPSIQRDYFLKRREAVSEQHPDLDQSQLNRLTHNFVADPTVAGHPAGAAIDVTIVDAHTKQAIDMGTSIADYSDPLLIQTFDSRVSKEVMKHRMMLHDALIAENFAPFYGEWWHFSYGDREWAAFYNKEALFGPIEFSLTDFSNKSKV